ncbi:hypothetical protein FKP32DRAFT_1615863 [Trametes sanguinea]|nr:hypothetical protein FKP32DRAFT_1615863 [Trametes sanguinea]
MPNPQGHNGKLPTPPDAVIRPHVEDLIRAGESYPKIVITLRKYYDCEQYHIGLESLKKKCRAWGIKRARGQGHTVGSIAPAVEEARQRFPNAGMRDMKSVLHHEHGIEVSEKTVLSYMKLAHPEEVQSRLRHRGGMVRKRFWAVGVNDIWSFDQHDKWKRFALYMHMCCEPVSGMVLWLKIWWTNRNPRLINSYYCDAVKEHHGIPMITQSDRGSENNGIANSQTILRQTYDPSLQGTLQHKWMHRKGQNIKPEIFWSELRRRWSPGFEALLDYGLNGELYDPADYLSRMLFYYLFIPYLQGELDIFRDRYNSSKKRRDKNKILPHGITVEHDQVEHVRQLYSGAANDPVYELVPQPFQDLADEIYDQIGSPPLSYDTIWEVYMEMLVGIKALADDETLSRLEGMAECYTSAAFQGEDVPVLDLAPFRADAGVSSEREEVSEDAGYSSDETALRYIVSEFTQGASAEREW